MTYYLFPWASYLSYDISFLVLLFFARSIPVLQRRLLLFFVLSSIFSDMLNLILMRYRIYSCYTFSIHELVSGMIMFGFYLSITKNRNFRILAIVLMTIVVFVDIWGVIEIYSGNYFFNIQYSVNNILSMVLAIFYFYQMLLDPIEGRIQENYLFWVNSAFLMYFGSITLLWLFESYITKQNNIVLQNYLWPIQNMASVIFNALIIRAVWQSRKSTRIAGKN